MKLREAKRAQVTVFIIIALVIVGLVVLGVLIYPRIKTTFGVSETPSAFIQTCMEDVMKETVQKLSLQGGSIEPEFFVMHDNEKVEYLCYTNENTRTCVVQQPMLKTHIQNEIKENVKSQADDCFNSLKENYQSQGYTVDLKKGAISTELLPSRVIATFNYTLTLTKTDTQRYDSFVVLLNNNLYELVAIANSIVEWETTQGKAPSEIYMSYYRDLKVEESKKSDGTIVYILTDKSNENKFQFASRSLNW